MDVIIRKATNKDYEGVCQLFKLLDLHHFKLDSANFQTYDGVSRPIDSFESYLTDGKKVFYVAQYKNKLVGLVSCRETSSPPYPMFKCRQFVEVSNLFVLPTYQKRGFGNLLMNSAKDWAKSKNINTLSVTVYSSNKGAVDFYSKLDFVSQKQFMELSI